jgi:DNA gyrase subunit A
MVLSKNQLLPTKLPNLLLMGSEGIAVGMATKIPPHNLTEANNAVIAMIKAGRSDYSQKLRILKLKLNRHFTTAVSKTQLQRSSCRS